MTGQVMERGTVYAHLSPRPLELTATSEMVVMDNMHIFTKNGFLFDIDPNGMCHAHFDIDPNGMCHAHFVQ